MSFAPLGLEIEGEVHMPCSVRQGADSEAPRPGGCPARAEAPCASGSMRGS